MEQFKGETLATLRSLDEKINKNSDKISHLEQEVAETVKTSVLLEVQIEQTKLMQETLKEHGIILVQVSNNLTSLSTGLEKLDQRVHQIEVNESGKKIDMGQLLKDVVFKVVPALVLAYFILKFGLK